MNINQSDIVALDFIIDYIFKNDRRINYSELVNEKIINCSDNKLEFKRLSNIIKYLNCANVIGENISVSIEKNENTNEFRNNGGFKSYFQEQLKRIEKEKEREKIETDLAKSNIEANTLNIENARKNKWHTGINIAIGVLNLILLALQLLKD